MAKLWRYTKKDLNGSTVPQSLPSPTSTQNHNLYHRITDLPLHKFITCLVDKDLSPLIISGTPTKNQLLEAWQIIYDEFSDAIGGGENKTYLSLLKDITKLDNKLKFVESIVNILSTPYRDESANDIILVLNKICNTKFKFNDPAELQRCIDRSMSIKIQLELKMMQLKEMQGKMEGENKKPTREQFLDTLIELSDHVKYEVTDKISVFDFFSRIKRYNKYCEHLEKRNSGRR